MERPAVPLSLIIVALLFFLGGAAAVIEVVQAFYQNRFSLNFGLLGLFIGPGLLRFRPGWRTCALFCLWLALIGIPIVSILFLASPGPYDLRLFGQEAGSSSRGLALAFCAGMFIATVWQYRVLTRPSIRAMFLSRR